MRLPRGWDYAWECPKCKCLFKTSEQFSEHYKNCDYHNDWGTW